MSQKGSLIVRTFASNQLIPIPGVRITVTKSTENGDELIAYGVTDKNGKTQIIQIDTPDALLSLDQNNTAEPFTGVNIKIEKEGFDITNIFNAQVFSGQLSEQYVEMVPLPEFSKFDEYNSIFTVTPQNL